MDVGWFLDQVNFIAAVVVPAVVLAGVARRPLPAASCVNCRYDLRGLEAPRPCPECGCTERGRHGPIWSARTWCFTPRRVAWSVGLIPVALGAALAMPTLVSLLWDAAHALVGAAPLASRVQPEMYVCFSLAYIGAFAAATIPLARLSPGRGFAAAILLIALGAGVQVTFLLADSISHQAWWLDAANRQRFVFMVFALVVASLTAAAVDPAFRPLPRQAR